jgi:peptidoglycan-associated lipoprotein
MALGQRRAASAKRYLSQRGIGDDRIEVISYGEERPAAQGNDEAAWSQNRRAEFEVTAGADALKVGQ